ncbi:hypothetical protein CTI12_AA547670 [Artemisia annua]|uniref:Uncharacterized protein n=1 Tax=Artemisia annua TaxID=35608 RepID=A0A2U1KZC1_ARTAN|nr:hypothetical protein CTI12_AA547670 [Artemisia annua]
MPRVSIRVMGVLVVGLRMVVGWDGEGASDKKSKARSFMCVWLKGFIVQVELKYIMKRTMPWSDDESDSSSDESSSHDTDASDNDQVPKKSKKISSGGSSKAKVESTKRKSKGIDFAALRQHGYKGGLSVLKVPPPKDDDKNRDWSWSNGKDKREANETEESYQERQKTRAMLLEGEQLPYVQTQKEKNLSFAQKEKRKRDMGQASRGKSYVEEEKRLLRDNGVYSGFDS